MDGIDALVNSSVVHVNNLLAFLAIAGDDGFLQVLHSIFNRDDTGQFEESSLHDHVDTTAKADAFSNLNSINGVEVDLMFNKITFQLSWKFLIQFCIGPRAVQEERAAIFQASHDIVAMNIRRVMNSYIVSRVDKERHMDRSMTETQVGHGNTAGLLGVISEVALCVHIGLIADDFDSALVGANRTIAAEAPEHAARGAFRGDVEYFFLREGGVRYIINDTNGEVVFRFSLLEVVEDSQASPG